MVGVGDKLGVELGVAIWVGVGVGVGVGVKELLKDEGPAPVHHQVLPTLH